MANPDLGAAHVAEIIAKNEGAIDENGWLRSGDKGVMDRNGMLMITGRYKELIIGAGGENVAPIPVEDDVKLRCPAISNIMMVGNKQPYCIALITLKNQGGNNEQPGSDALDEEALEIGQQFGCTTITQAVQNNDFIQYITDAIQATNKNTKAVPKPPSSIKRFTIMPFNFSVANEEFTPTFKLKRGFVENKYSAAVSKIYAAPRGAMFVNTLDEFNAAAAAETKE